MAVRQYIGARYVPVFADPIQWDNTRTYEPLTMVQNNGDTYITRQAVPVGIDILNTEYWVFLSNWNAQIETYRNEVLAFDDRITANADNIADLSEAVTPETKSIKIKQTETTTEFVNGETSIVADPLYCAQKCGALANPLPILYYADSYRTATNLVYGNDFTATNINANGTWEPARSHKNSDDTMNIDCTTFVILASMGIRYAASTYSTNGLNVGKSYYFDPFSEQVAKYISYEADQLGTTVEPRHNRLLTSELAKMLNDRGLLVKIYNPYHNTPDQQIPITLLQEQVDVGDVVFFANSSNAWIWEGLGHCAIVAAKVGNQLVLMDANVNRGNTPVRYILASNLNQIKYKFTPPQATYPHLGASGYSHAGNNTTGSTFQTFATAGYGVFQNKGTHSGAVTFTYTYPSESNVGTISETITIPLNGSHLVIVPAGVRLDVTFDNTVIETLGWKVNLTPYGINADPASLNS